MSQTFFCYLIYGVSSINLIGHSEFAVTAEVVDSTMAVTMAAVILKSLFCWTRLMIGNFFGFASIGTGTKVGRCTTKVWLNFFDLYSLYYLLNLYILFFFPFLFLYFFLYLFFCVLLLFYFILFFLTFFGVFVSCCPSLTAGSYFFVLDTSLNQLP